MGAFGCVTPGKPIDFLSSPAMQDVHPVSTAGSEPINPYAAPEADISAPSLVEPDLATAEVIRKKHINAEQNLRTLGFLLYLGGGLVFVGGVYELLFALSNHESPLAPRFMLYAATNLLLGVISVKTAGGLRKLKNSSRIWAIVLMILVIISPLAWLALYCLMNKKGRFVCSPEYARIIEQTPQVRYKTSILAKLFAFFVVAIFFVIAMLLESSGQVRFWARL